MKPPFHLLPREGHAAFNVSGVLEDSVSNLTTNMEKKQPLGMCEDRSHQAQEALVIPFSALPRGGTLLTETCAVMRMFYRWLWMRYRLGSLIIINLQIALNVLLRFLRND